MKKFIASTVGLILFSSSALASDGLINVASVNSVEETANRLEKVLNKKGMTIFNRIKHSDGASKVGVDLRPTQLIIFGNPKVGSPLMKCQQSVAIDLPLKALIWEDAEGKTWISYNDISYLHHRHNISGCEATLAKMTGALTKFTQFAASK